MIYSTTVTTKTIKPEHVFIISSLVVNGGNYLYNLLLGRVLGPTKFADAAILITLFLALSFVAMTVQIATTKFSVSFSGSQKQAFLRRAYRFSYTLGAFIGIVLVLFSGKLQAFFNTQSAITFVILGLAIPIYFAMSCKRGVLQGMDNLIALSVSYQIEMWTRFLITFALILFFNLSADVAVASSILIAVFCGYLPYKKYVHTFASKVKLNTSNRKKVLSFFLITLCYECTLIMCNNSDIILVKHYFEPLEAGYYSSLALIGRVVYFITWMLVMLLLPKVIKANKHNENTLVIFKKYLSYIGFLAVTITVLCHVFPEQIITVLFGKQFLDIAPLLSSYALATSLFAIANVFAYYFLCLEKYLPIFFALLMGIGQIVFIIWFHETLQEVVYMQIVAMGFLLLMQLAYFFYQMSRASK